MIINTFFEPLLPHQNSLLEYWKKTWEHHGWIPKVLGLKDVPKDKKTIDFFEKTKAHPRINSWGFEYLCYARWLALRNIGGGFLVDYDVINYGVEPIIPTHECEQYGPQHIWGFVYGSETGLDLFIDEMKNNGKTYSIDIRGKRHVSDAYIGTLFDGIHTIKKIRQYMPIDIMNKKSVVVKPCVIHYNNHWHVLSYNKGTKYDSIKCFEKEYGIA